MSRLRHGFRGPIDLFRFVRHGRAVTLVGLVGLLGAVGLDGIHHVSADPPRRGRSRPRTHLAEAAGERPPLPQECAMDPFHVDYGGLESGVRVRLGRHREVDGDTFWTDEMNEFVGRITRVTGSRGVDVKGCPVVSVAADDGEYDWRIRDMEVVSAGADDALAALTLSPGFAGDPRTFSGTVVVEGPLEGCPGNGSRAATLRLTLTDDFTTLAVLAHGERDLVLMVRTPDGEVICADDVDDLDPVISGNAGAGVYEIWVGVYASDADDTAFRVGISEKLTVHTADLDDQSATPIRGPSEDDPDDDDGESGETSDVGAGRPRTGDR